MFAALARAATGNAVASEFLPFLYVSNSCYMLVGAVTFGMTWALIVDREHYGMLKYIFISPAKPFHRLSTTLALRAWYFSRSAGFMRFSFSCAYKIITGQPGPPAHPL